MRKVVLIVLMIFVAAPTVAGILTVTPPATYTDSSTIPTAKIPTMAYTPMWGPTDAGQGMWPNVGDAGAAGVATFTVPDPPAGATWYYTATVTLDGQTSGKAVAASKTVPFKVPGAPAVAVQ